MIIYDGLDSLINSLLFLVMFSRRIKSIRTPFNVYRRNTPENRFSPWRNVKINQYEKKKIEIARIKGKVKVKENLKMKVKVNEILKVKVKKNPTESESTS